MEVMLITNKELKSADKRLAMDSIKKSL